MFRQATTTHPLVRLFTISSRLSNNRIQKFPLFVSQHLEAYLFRKRRERKKQNTKDVPDELTKLEAVNQFKTSVTGET